ncbi:glutaredoxin 3 [Litorivivens lipolytica]|uniref:Glutaredoxin n=1 Tax=Litorivivens lipolytica TaxID=1524264 RepID=A0A7W4W7F3_9GAMM|nr:glutaredoxin 3 [Litorivivens lipolytica]MBB3048418.1 glutaredoxin 3 [Litorivivens lipolytica]
MSRARIYTTRFCPYCIHAKQLLQQKGADFEEIPVDGDRAMRAKLVEMSGGSTTVPQIWIGETYVGGCDELVALERRGELNALLAQ